MFVMAACVVNTQHQFSASSISRMCSFDSIVASDTDSQVL